MRTKNLIIGGGFAGLYLAYILGDATIVEASNKVGGLLRGFKSPSNKFTFDVGGHVYTSKDAPLAELMNASNANFIKERLAYFDYKLKVPYPIQYHAEQLGIQVTPNPLPAYDGLSQLLRHEFGDELFKQILEPFNRRVWSTPPSKLAADWVAGRVAPMKDKTENWGPNGSFYYAMGEDILNTLLSRVKGTEILFNSPLRSVDVEGKVAHVSVRNAKNVTRGIQYERIFDTSGWLLWKYGGFLPHNNVLTIGLGLNKRLQEDFHWWYNGTNNKSPIHRVTLLSRYHDKLAPEGKDSLLIEIPHEPLDNLGLIETVSDKYWTFGTIALLRQAGFQYVDEKDVDEIVIIKSKGYPIPVIGHRTRVAYAREGLRHKDAYLVGRWGAHGYYNLDHIMLDAVASKYASQGVAVEDYAWANYYYKEQRKN